MGPCLLDAYAQGTRLSNADRDGVVFAQRVRSGDVFVERGQRWGCVCSTRTLRGRVCRTRTEMGPCWLNAYAVPNVLPSFPITVEAISVSIIKEDFLALSTSSAEPMVGCQSQ